MGEGEAWEHREANRNMREERRVVTVLSADLVGSTALSERLDPEDVKLIIGDAVGRLVRLVEEFGGTVKDVAGDGVLALFGAPVAHEDDAERAVRAGLQMVQESTRFGAEVAGSWGTAGPAVRIGIDTGPVVFGTQNLAGTEQPSAFGDPLNTASRLQSAADPNTILVSEATRRLIAPMFDWGELRSLTLKGKSEPIPAREAKRERGTATKVRGLEGVQARFVGRDRELAVGEEATTSVLSGSGGLLYILGEPGIGKSRLSIELRQAFLQSSPARGRPQWLEGRCVSYGESLPYWPYRDLLREWLGVGAHEPELRTRIALRRQLERLFRDRLIEIYPYLAAMLGLTLEPDAAAHVANLSPEALQYRTFEVVRTLLKGLAQDGPLVVAIEDLHWADATSIQLTDGILPLTETAGLLLVITQRLERSHSSWTIKERAVREFPHRTREVVLEPLTGEADRELLTSLVGASTLPRTLEDRILTSAEGNPFYLEELVRTLADGGALVNEGGRWRFDHDVPIVIPPTVEKVILTRIDRLTSRSRDVLTAASILGRRFTLPQLQGVSEENGAVEDALHELQRADLVRPGRRWPQPEYRFKHALIQEAAYRTIVRSKRTTLHRRAAEWLEKQYADNPNEMLGVLAHHWLGANDEDKAIAYLTRAGDKARQEYALDEAIGHYQALLPLLERREERRAIALVLFKLALALHTSLRFAEANAVYQQAFEHWTPPRAWPESPTAMLRIGQVAIPSDPDPTRSYLLQNIQMCMALFDRLVERWPEATIVPSLAERWEISDDGRRYVFHLRQGLRWSDGVSLTAQDVVFAVQRILDPDRPGDSAAIYFVLENGQDYFLRRHRDPDRIGVHALDERTVEFRLVAPAPYFMSVVNRPDSGPIPRHAIEQHGDAWSDLDRQVVSGPFRRVEWSADRVVLERRADYPRQRPGNVRRVEYRRGPITRIAREYRDEIDIADMRSAFDLAAMFAAAGEDAHPGPPAALTYIVLDHAHPALSNVDFRRALAYAIDRETLRKLVSAPLTIATGGVVPPPLQGHTPDIAPRFDPRLALEYLSKAGGAAELGVLVVQETQAGVLMEAVASMWHELLGLPVDVRRLTFQDFVSIDDPRTIVPVFTSGWFPGYPDPEYFLRLLLHSDARDNNGGYRNPDFDALIEQARRERGDRARLELYHQADRMAVADQVGIIPLAYGRNVAFVKPWVQGWWEFGKSWANFADLIVESRTSDERPE